MGSLRRCLLATCRLPTCADHDGLSASYPDYPRALVSSGTQRARLDARIKDSAQAVPVLVSLPSELMGVGMDPVTLILTALAAGAALGVKDTASAAVKDAYEGLKALVKNRFTGRRDGELVLARYEEAPDSWEGPLAAELTGVGAAADVELVAAAQAVMRLVDEAGSRAGKYNVQVHGGQGVQVGDGNIQHNTFGVASDC